MIAVITPISVDGNLVLTPRSRATLIPNSPNQKIQGRDTNHLSVHRGIGCSDCGRWILRIFRAQRPRSHIQVQRNVVSERRCVNGLARRKYYFRLVSPGEDFTHQHHAKVRIGWYLDVRNSYFHGTETGQPLGWCPGGLTVGECCGVAKK